MLPCNVVMDRDCIDQCIRQWTRSNYGKQYNVNVASDDILYFFLTDALKIYLSDVPKEIKRTYQKLTRVMLNRKRFGTDVSEYNYLIDSHPPAPVTGKEDKIVYILEKCVKFSGAVKDSIKPFTLWSGIIQMTEDVDLINIQRKFCEKDLQENGIEYENVIDFLKGKIPKIKSYTISGIENYEYICYITLDDTSDTGGYVINPHSLSKNVICSPKYVLTKDAYDTIRKKDTLKCPLCQSKMSTNNFKIVGTEEEVNKQNKENGIDFPTIKENIYDTSNHILLDIPKSMYDNNEDCDNDVYEMNKCDFNTTSYTINAPMVEEALGNRFIQVKTQEEFNKIVDDKYSFLKDIDMTGVCLAGGFCRSVLLKQRLKDFDFFFYGDNYFENFRRVLKQSCDAIQKQRPDIKFLMMYKQMFNVFEVICVTDPTNFLSNEYSLDNFKQYDFKSLHRFDKFRIIDPETGKVYHKKNKWTESEEDTSMKDIENRDFSNYFEDGDISGVRMIHRLQFILCKNNSIKNILENFDFDPCKVAFDGKTTYFSNRSERAYKYMINIIDECSYTTLFDYRVAKYFSYGFSIILPELDMEKVKQIEYIKFSDVSFRIKRTDGNSIMVNHNSHIEDKLKSIQALEAKSAKKGKALYKSSMFCSLVAILRYVKINEVNYMFTDKCVIPSEDNKMKFRESEVLVHFIDKIDSKDYKDLYGDLRYKTEDDIVDEDDIVIDDIIDE
jgi:hypothetical protein